MKSKRKTSNLVLLKKIAGMFGFSDWNGREYVEDSERMFDVADLVAEGFTEQEAADFISLVKELEKENEIK